MDTINKRIEAVRKSLDLSMDKFGSKIGITRSQINNLEKGANNPAERTIRLICMEFNVNENWLRTGEGQMFNELSREEEIAEYLGDLIAGDGEEVDFQKRFIRALSKLSVDEWKLIKKIAKELTDDE